MAHFLHLSHSAWKGQDAGDGLFTDWYSESKVNDCSLNHTNTNCSSASGGVITSSAIPTYFSLISCSLSCLGSILIFISYFALKGIRNVAQKIITALAVADLFTAIGYIMAGWNFLANIPNDCRRFKDVCEVQSFITSWSSLSSFGWSCALALHFYLLLSVKKKSKLATLFNWENVVLWLSPLLVLVPLLVTHQLGYSHLAVSNWCFIHHQKDKPWLEILLILLAGKFWEVLSYFFVIIVYALTRRKFNKHVRVEATEEQPILPSGVKDEGAQRRPGQEARSEARQRLHVIPLVFVLLRVWGTLQFVYFVSRVNGDGCLPKAADYTILRILSIIQAIGDGGQGWSNALVYIFLSPTMRRQLFLYPLVRLIIFVTKKKKKKRRTNSDKEDDERDIIQRPISRREHTHGVSGSTAREFSGSDDIYGEDSGVDAEMTSVTNGH